MHKSPYCKIVRKRLNAKLDAAFAGKLTLMIAPAGFGKTTAVAQWLLHRCLRHAWLSLDEGDNDAVHFWTYVIGALETLPHDIGDTVQTMLRSSAPPWEAIISSLIDSLEDIPFDFALVLDDYHVVDDPLVHETFAFLMRYAPQRMHVVILSRYLVPLPFSRLRLSGQMTELTATELSSSEAEAKLFYEQRDVRVTDEDVAKLVDLTSGWVAGMQIAAMSLVRGSDQSIMFDHFDASAGCFDDYFMEEVFGRFNETTQAFLMQTSILERLCGPLCEAVTGAPNGQPAIETIARQGGFLICLDDAQEARLIHNLCIALRTGQFESSAGAALTFVCSWHPRREFPRRHGVDGDFDHLMTALAGIRGVLDLPRQGAGGRKGIRIRLSRTSPEQQKLLDLLRLERFQPTRPRA